MTIAVIFLVCAAIVVAAILLAPFGYQDDNGFHKGKPNDKS